MATLPSKKKSLAGCSGTIRRAYGMDAFGQIRMHWNDMFEIEIFPAVTGEQGMEMARQATAGG